MGAGAIAGTLLTPVVVPAGLSLIGFGATGPVAGSMAAVWQASIGNVAVGSVFSTIQSAAMGGAIPTVVNAVGAVAAAGASAVVYLL